MVFQKGQIGYWAGKKRPEFSGKNHPMYGKHHTKESKEKTSLTMLGTPKSKKHKKNISLGRIGMKRQPFSKKWRKNMSLSHIGHSSGMLGKHHSEDTKKIIGLSISGKDNPNWLGGISFEPYSPEFNDQFKEYIRERDNRVCQICREPENGRKLAVHHINYNKKDCQPENLISLCNKHNVKVNFNREYWMDYFKNLMNN